VREHNARRGSWDSWNGDENHLPSGPLDVHIGDRRGNRYRELNPDSPAEPTLWNRAVFSVAEVFSLLVCGVLPSCL
jgi:hypothetical protein